MYIFIYYFLIYYLLFHVILLIYLHNQYLPLPCIQIYKTCFLFCHQTCILLYLLNLIKITSWVLLFWKPKSLIFPHRQISTYYLSIKSSRTVTPNLRKCLSKAGNPWNWEEPWKVWEMFSAYVWAVADFHSVSKEQWVEPPERSHLEWSGKDIRSLLAGNKIFKGTCGNIWEVRCGG